MTHIKNFFIKIKDFIGKNYWLQPVLLVAVVFAVVFSITGITDAFNTVKGWFTPNADTCRYCTTTYKTTKYAQFDSALTAATDEENPVFIVITQEGCSSCATLYPLLNKFLKANDDIDVIQLRLSYDDDGEIEFDSVDSKNKFKALAQALYDVAINNGDSASSLQTAMYSGSEISFGTPTLLVYANKNASDLKENILRYKIGTFESTELLRLNDFFTKRTNGFFTLDY